MDLQNAISIFNTCIDHYHLADAVDAPLKNPYSSGTIEQLLYEKSWTDNVQWHLEDEIRDTGIDPGRALVIKRQIDKYNQRRTDLVEMIDDWFMNEYKNVSSAPDAELNTETPAWAIDRLSILELKIYHMKIEAGRDDASEEHRSKCRTKLVILQEQETDLVMAIQQLLTDISEGKKILKVYRQMKMYNDASLNPVLYQQKNKN